MSGNVNALLSDQDAIDRVQEIARSLDPAIIIGGWASWQRLNSELSHDVDMIVAVEDLQAVRAIAPDLSISKHVGATKYRGTTRDGIHVDVYVPYQSRLGQRLQVRVENLSKYAEMGPHYRVLTPGAHFVTKMAALLDRPDSVKGSKDRRELLGLLKTGSVDLVQVDQILAESTRLPDTMRRQAIDETLNLLGDLALRKNDRAMLTRTARDYHARATQTPRRSGGEPGNHLSM